MSKDFHGLPQLPESALLLLRIAPARNMRRFYRLDVLPDLFGGVLHMKQWGRIGSRGQCRMGRFEDAVDAYVTLRAQATHKKRRGYTAPAEQWAGCRRLTPGSEKGRHADPRQGVGALIHRMAVVAAHPGPGDRMRLADRVDPPPQIFVLNGIPARGPPAARLPSLDPDRRAVAQILRVGDDLDGAGSAQRLASCAATLTT